MTQSIIFAWRMASRQPLTTALVVLTLYSPFMWAANWSEGADLRAQFEENPQAVNRGLAIMTENVLTLARACRRRASMSRPCKIR